MADQTRTSETLDIDDLVTHYDKTSADTYLSVFADLTSGLWERALAARRDEILEAIGPEKAEKVRFEAAWEMATSEVERLARSDAKGAAVFVSPVHDLQAVQPLSGRVTTQAILDSSPYVTPLAQHLDAYPPFLLVLLDGQRGVVWRVEAGQAEVEASEKMDLIGRHKKGGFSQMRYQRHRAGRVDALMDELIERIAEIVREEGIDRLIVAGPGQVKDRLVDRLPPHLQEILGAVEDLDLDDPRDDPDVERFVRMTRRLEAEENEALVDELKDAVRSGGLATTDAFAVARAARNGRVDTLLVLRGHTAGGRKCEEHQSFFEMDATCECGNAGTEVDLLNEAVEHTLRTDGQVEFVDRDEPFLEARGGIGAFLRW